MTTTDPLLTTEEMRSALPSMILSLTDRQVELVTLALAYIKQGMQEETALQKAYEEMIEPTTLSSGVTFAFCL